MPKTSTFHARLLGATLLAVASSWAQAGILFDYGKCNPADGACDQSVIFSPENSGISVVGDTNPAPSYLVYAESLEGLTLHGAGSSVDAGNGNPGFLSLLLYPQMGWGWRQIEFQLNSHLNLPPQLDALTFTAWNQGGTSFLFSADFPWESDNGQNQHYHFHGTDGDLITALRLDYDPGTTGNFVGDMHNIDVNSAQVPAIPEPGTLALLGAGLLAAGRRRRGGVLSAT